MGSSGLVSFILFGSEEPQNPQGHAAALHWVTWGPAVRFGGRIHSMQVESPGQRGRGIKRALGVHGGTHLGVEHRKVSAGCLAMVLW